MKKCPFCAERIRDEAIKCRYCGSFLATAPSPHPSASGDSPGALPATPEPLAGAAAPPPSRRQILYTGTPMRRAFLAPYAAALLLTTAGPLGSFWVARALEAEQRALVLAAAVPIALGLSTLLALALRRRSRVVRVTSSSVETEQGILSKKIDAIELWRCRDVRYRQSMLDRLLGVGHIELFTEDASTPRLSLTGMPASRRLFDSIRDAIDSARQSHDPRTLRKDP